MPDPNILQVTCDESGAEGENVAQSHHRVFCHGSVSLEVDEAQSLMDRLKTLIGSRRSELKANDVINSTEALALLLDPSSPLRGRACMVLVDKQYFLVAKVVDLLIE